MSISEELLKHECDLLANCQKKMFEDIGDEVYHSISVFVDQGLNFFKQEIIKAEKSGEVLLPLDTMIRDMIYTAYWTGVIAEREGFRPSKCLDCSEEVKKRIEKEE